jgi:hypothetical protein
MEKVKMVDPFLDFSCALMMNEFPNIDAAKIPTVRSWIARFLAGAMPYEEARQLVLEHCGTATCIDKIQDILTVLEEPTFEAKTKGILQMTLKGPRNKTRTWTSQEDNRLLAGIRKFGIDAGTTWSAIAKFVGNGRSGSQCSQRWLRVLDPRICKGEWTSEDDSALRHFVEIHGEKSWKKIGAELGNRSDVQCRYRYLKLQREESKPKSLVMPIIPHQDQPDPFADNVPIPLTTSLDLKKSDPLFDSSIWLC